MNIQRNLWGGASEGLIASLLAMRRFKTLQKKPEPPTKVDPHNP